MFNFMKKSGAEKEEREKRKKEKKERKENKRDRGSMSTEELLRLDEVRRSLKIGGRRKEKEKLPSGITADYTASFFAGLDYGPEIQRGSSSLPGHSLSSAVTSVSSRIHHSGSLQSDSSEASMTSLNTSTTHIACPLPPLPPRPPKRGILKGARLDMNVESDKLVSSNEKLDSRVLVISNTLKNEVISYPSVSQIAADVRHLNNDNADVLNEPVRIKNGFDSSKSLCGFSSDFSEVNSEIFPSVRTEDDSGSLAAPSIVVESVTNKLTIVTSTSPSADSLTDTTTTNSSFATPPFSLSPVGESQGFKSFNSHWNCYSGNMEDLTVELPLPQLIPLLLPPPRLCTLQRSSPREDFGFSVHCGIIIDRLGNCEHVSKTVILVEPSSRLYRSEMGLFQGDRLLEINGVVVDTENMDNVLDMIKSSGTAIVVKVQSAPEMLEVIQHYGFQKSNSEHSDVNSSYCQRSSCFKNIFASSEEHPTGHNWLIGAEHLWLVHHAGFTAVHQLPDDSAEDLDSGKIQVRVEVTGDVLTVDDGLVEKASPPRFNYAEDVSHLPYLNESSMLHTLCQRFASSLVYTYAGKVLMFINPMAPLAVYSEKVMHLFHGCKTQEMPPHIYSIAQSAYQNMLASRHDQSIILLGRSGSGKTTNFKHIVHYLLLATGTVNKVLSVEKFNAISLVLEAFGNAKTFMNLDATRFTQIFTLDFDQSGQIASASLKVLLLESSRIANRTDGECVFHIFYSLLAGADDQLRKQLKLDAENNELNLFITPFQKYDDKQKAMADFNNVCTAFKVLGVTDGELHVIWSILASIYHLGFAGTTKAVNSSSWCQFANPQAAQRAASLLGLTLEELNQYLFEESISTRPSLEKDHTSLEILELFVVSLYKEVFCAIAALINRSISTTMNTVSSLLLVDTPGFQNPASCGYQEGAGFQDLCHNYLQERLHKLFHHTVLVVPRDRYIQENIEFNVSDPAENNPCSSLSVVSLLDNTVQNIIVHTSQTDIRETERRGLFWLLDEEALSAEASDRVFLDRLFMCCEERDCQLLLQKAPGNHQFVLQHLQGTNPVLYTACGWVKYLQENLIMRNVVPLLQQSSLLEMRKLFLYVRYQEMQSSVADCVMGIDEAETLRRASSIRHNCSFGSANFKGKTFGVQFKFIVDALIELLRRTKCSFVYCFLPHHNAGITDLQSSSWKKSTSVANLNGTCINVPLMRSQLRGAQILNAARLHKEGFPTFMPLTEFRRRFRILAPLESDPASPALNEMKMVENMMLVIDLDATLYRIGISQIFFRSGVLALLESQRDEKMRDKIVRLQAFCRRYLVRQTLAKLKVQDMAVRCIQRNVRIFLSVRDWPWWRLLMRVTPLLNVHRMEEELRMKSEEVEVLRTKVGKMEQARLQLQQKAERLEMKLNKMTAKLADEHSTSLLLSEHLETETAERSKLEKELQQVQSQNVNLHQNAERLEMELLHLQVADVNDDASNPNEESSSSIYKMKFQRAVQDLEFTRRHMQQQHEDDMEQLICLKKQLEKKMVDSYNEADEHMKIVAQWKCKLQKLSAENNDIRLLLEEQTARNALLEKKQRKFDSELQHLKDELHQEKQQREHLLREKELALAGKFNVEQELKNLELELESKVEKIQTLTQQLDEFSFGGKSEAEVLHLKKAKHDLEKKLKDQEDELDDMAGQIQLLEQAKLRLEMNLEQMRKEHRREMVQRDEEFEDVRCNAHKKVKALEAQLENEHEKRTQLLREKHEFERRLAAIEEESRNKRAVEEDQLQRLRRDLRRTKALLHDAQTMLQRMHNDAPNKAVLRQLRNQLEDAEFARSAAVKAKQLVDMDLAEVQTQLEDVNRAKTEAEERAITAMRELSDARLQLEENEEELADVLKKYRAAVEQLSVDQTTITEQASQIATLESDCTSLREQVLEMSSRLENAEAFGDATTSLAHKKLELQVRELQTKLELEQTTSSRTEIQIGRLKESVEKLQNENIMLRNKEHSAQDQLRKMQKTVRELHDVVASAEARELEANKKRKDLEKRVEVAEAEAATAVADLRLALKRIEDLQLAIQGEMEDGSDSEHGSSNRDHDSDQSDDLMSYCSTSMENA